MGSVSPPTFDHDVDIIIIGGGLSGCYALWALRQLKPAPTIKLLEAAGDFGGVWHWNRYPGARVDSHWPYYQLNIPEVWEDWKFTELYPDHNEIRAYFKHMDKVLDLQRDAVFDIDVNEVYWDEGLKKWNIYAINGGAFRCRHLIVCSGSSSKTYVPGFKGLHRFRGTWCHSARFFEGDFDVTGKRIGIIGNGATALQIVSTLSKQDCELVNFIRTPINGLPLRTRKIMNHEAAHAQLTYPALFESIKATRTGIFFPINTVAFKDATNEQRDAILQKAWDWGSFTLAQSTFKEVMLDEEANRYVYNFWANKVRARVTDPEKRDIVAPLPQQNWFASKRPGLEHDYYESIDRPNVKLVSLKRTPFREITETGVLTEDGTLHELDVLIFATGYDALNGSQMAIGLHDRNGKSLRDKWSQGTETYLGLTIPGHPNTFFCYGPQAPTALGNAPPMIEVAVQWIAKAIQAMEDEGIETLEAQPQAAKKWRAGIQASNARTLLARAGSWSMGEPIPGKVQEHLKYLGGLGNYVKEITDALDGWKGFDLGMKPNIATSDGLKGIENGIVALAVGLGGS